MVSYDSYLVIDCSYDKPIIRLGRDRVGVFTGDKDRSTIKQFVNS